MWSSWIGSLAADDPVGGGVSPNSASHAVMRRRVNFGTGLEISAWRKVFRRHFHRRVDQRETLLLVCSSAKMEVVGKSCRQQGVPTAVVASVRLHDDDNAIGV